MNKRYNPIENEGVHAVGRIFNKKYGWIFREQLKADMGVDAHIEICDNRKPLGRLIALQIKSGLRWFKEKNINGFVFRGSQVHLEYWLSHSLPVIVILYNPKTEESYWQVILKSTITATEKGWKTIIPIANNLENTAAAELRKYAVEPPAVQQLRRILSMRNDVNFEEKITSVLNSLQSRLAEVNNDRVLSLSQLSGYQILSLKICLKIKDMGISIPRIKIIYDFLGEDDMMAHIIRMVILGYQMYLIFSTDDKPAIWDARDLADYIFIGAEERDQAEIVICLNKFVNEVLQSRGLPKRDVLWHLFMAYEEYIQKIDWVWKESVDLEQSNNPVDPKNLEKPAL